MLVEMVPRVTPEDVKSVFRLIGVGVRHGQLRPLMTGVVIGSSDLCSVPSGLSHTRRAYRESRALHCGSRCWSRVSLTALPWCLS